MKVYSGLNKNPILNGEYKLLRSIDYLTEIVGIANFKDGLLDGKKITLDPSGIVIKSENYENGVLISENSIENPNEYMQLANDETKTSKRNGNYILYANNETSIFTLKNGLFEKNKWIFNDNPNFDSPRLLSIEHFVDNHHVGEQVFFHEDGKIMLIEYYREHMGALPEKSTWFDYDEKGNLVSERNFRRNKKDGRHKYYNENGTMYKDISYRDGKLFGPSIYHREDGTKLVIDYEFGFKVGERIE
ncbi:hypothetical protein STFE110948_00215 [Streptobacillus felis]|uniref:Toxin-antitoxin system YwqK family antitoxin n=1 Tax=Streptobacillus felis TaxID=1384509 RepID=A0A7Z0T6L1_9FUSO|nr:hypothetical protein [Streptobacillus felis]NYV27321.1 hypothetical protein [Streptobacillus felis]